MEANRLKPSTTISAESIYRIHLEPAFGSVRLDAIDDEAVQKFKGTLHHLSPKTLGTSAPGSSPRTTPPASTGTGPGRR